MSRVALASAPNLRGLGGLPVDGGRVKDDAIYRSATLAELTPEDTPAFSALGIRTVYDFRTEGERTASPDRLPADVTQVHLDVLADSTVNIAANVGDLAKAPAALAASLGDGQAASLLEDAYRDIVRLPSAKAAYRAFVLGVLDEDRTGAFLFHCTTGKDRTGWAAAFLLTALGASHETVLADYLQTNTDLLPSLEPLLQQAEAAGVPRALLLPVLGVRESYLAAAFAEVEQQYGSVERYLVDGLGLPADVVAQLRARLVETSA